MTRPVDSPRTADAAAAALSLDRRSALALHLQLSSQLRQMILSARMPPGARLPSSRSLAEELLISRATVVLAYDQLAGEGYVEGRQGAGIFVSPSLPQQALQAAAPPRPAQRGAPPSSGGEAAGGEAVAPPPAEIHVARPIRPFTGAPDPNLFPYQQWARLLHRIWRSPRPALLGGVDPFGWPDLRAAIARHLAQWRGILCNAGQIIVTSGAVDAIDLIARSAFSAGDTVHIEDPGYPTLRHALERAGLQPDPVLVDADGFDPARAKKHPARGAVVTPSRQFPLGVTLPLARRLALLDWAAAVDGYVVEDDFDSEYRYEGAPLPALMSLDRQGRAIYIGSFSKVLSPTLRLGFVVVPEHLVGSFRRTLGQRGSMASLLPQPVLAEFMNDGAYATHIRRTRRIYARRLAALLAQRDRLDGLLELAPTAAGMHVVADFAPGLAERMTDREAAERAREVGVTASALADHYAGRPQRSALILGFAGFSEEQCEAAVGRLAGALRRR
jgi:GntR family transcriptional regulator / MocR family aminotransferase